MDERAASLAVASASIVALAACSGGGDMLRRLACWLLE